MLLNFIKIKLISFTQYQFISSHTPKHMGSLLLIFLFIFPLPQAKFDQSHFLFQQGNDLYEKNQYKAAIKQYELALQSGYASGTLYYNLGNAYYKTGNIGFAILSYERAKRLLPNDEDIEFNLAIANLRVVDKIIIPPKLFFFQWTDHVRNLLSLNQLTWLTTFLYLFLALIIIIRIVWRKRKVKKYLKIVSIVVTLFFIIVLAIFISRWYESATKVEAIIIAEKVNVRSAPEISETEVFALHEGVKVLVTDTAGDWNMIRLPDGKVGWVLKDKLVVI